MQWQKPRSKRKLKTAHTSKFRAGQRWSYHARETEPDATFVVLRVETTEAGKNLVHVRLEGLHLVHPGIGQGWSHTFPHVPFDEEFVLESAIEVVGEGDISDLKDYWGWRIAWLSGGADIFQMTLAQAAEYLEKLLIEQNTPDAPPGELNS